MNVLTTVFVCVVFPGFIFTAVVGLFLTWVERKVTARVQWRVGPPWYQPYADFLKLLLKETMIPEGASKFLFFLAPLIGLIAVTTLSVMLFVMNFRPGSSFIGDLIVIIYLFALLPLSIIIGGSASKNPLASIGASREMTLYFAYELPFLLATATVILKSGGTIFISKILSSQAAHPHLYSVSGVIAGIVMLLSAQAKVGYVPFDAPEAEQEIMSGPYIEYSGAALAVYRITRAMMLVVLPVYIITMLWGGLTSWTALLKFLLIIVLMVLIKNTNPRLRIDQALKFFWFGLGPVAALGLILAFLGF
jgi:NADH-quinone oxidoreductase subunit H